MESDWRGFGVNARNGGRGVDVEQDRKSTRLNSSHLVISYAVFCLKKKHFHACREYIAENPRKPRLREGSIVLPRRDALVPNGESITQTSSLICPSLCDPSFFSDLL